MKWWDQPWNLRWKQKRKRRTHFTQSNLPKQVPIDDPTGKCPLRGFVAALTRAHKLVFYLVILLCSIFFLDICSKRISCIFVRDFLQKMGVGNFKSKLFCETSSKNGVDIFLQNEAFDCWAILLLTTVTCYQYCFCFNSLRSSCLCLSCKEVMTRWHCIDTVQHSKKEIRH